MIREQAERTPQGQWVRVIGGWSPYQFEERRMPTVAELNEAAPRHADLRALPLQPGPAQPRGRAGAGPRPRHRAPPGGRYEFVDGGAILHAEPNPAILYR